jgi:hypothetical protein
VKVELPNPDKAVDGFVSAVSEALAGGDKITLVATVFSEGPQIG